MVAKKKTTLAKEITKAIEEETAAVVESVDIPETRDRTQAEIDADTLIGAQEIRRDPQRFMAARAVNPNIQA